MNIEAVQSYKTPDGRVFQTKEEAVSYLYRQRFVEQARAYVETRGMTKINATRAINVIADYLVYAHLQTRNDIGGETS